MSDPETAPEPGAADEGSAMPLVRCPKCGNAHFEHAGYIELLRCSPEPENEGEVSCRSSRVMVCTKCGRCYVWHEGQVSDVTRLIDLQAWAEMQKKLHDTGA